VTLIIAAGLVGGRAQDVAIDPRTGDTTICRASPLNPWSQQESRIGDHIAQGWKRPESKESIPTPPGESDHAPILTRLGP